MGGEEEGAVASVKGLVRCSGTMGSVVESGELIIKKVYGEGESTVGGTTRSL